MVDAFFLRMIIGNCLASVKIEHVLEILIWRLWNQDLDEWFQRFDS